jgi:hypothetical protein
LKVPPPQRNHDCSSFPQQLAGGIKLSIP